MSRELISDDELYALMLQQNRKAYHDIYDRYKQALMVYALQRVDPAIAEDLVQDVFVKLWNNRDTILIEEKFVGYLFKSLRNRILDYMARDENKYKYLESLHTFADQFSSFESDQKLREENFLKSIHLLLLKYNPQYPVILDLRIEGYSNQEIAEVLGVSEKTVRNQYSLLLKILKDKLPYLLIFFLPIS